MLRQPEEVGDLTDKGRRKMPAMMRGADARYLTLTRRQIDKIKKSETFNQGYSFTELLAAHNLDLEWHTLPADAPLQNVDQFEAEALRILLS